ncbi:sugar transferase [Patulibacter minatonensis]|uniref:sugar transferase n=1 Tax=Patulibacter minatonensis TaxID=298163 RepID=UPI000685105E|nr:sugar transferase [Patulibacter minatonensis]
MIVVMLRTDARGGSTTPESLPAGRPATTTSTAPRGARRPPVGALRTAVPVLAALPVLLVGGLHAGILAAVAFLAAAVLDARRPTAISTMPLARHAITAFLVVACTAGGGLAALAVWGTLPAPGSVLLGAVGAIAGLVLAEELAGRRGATRIVVLGTEDETIELGRTIEAVGARRFRVVAGTDSLVGLDDLMAQHGADLLVHTDHVSRPAVLGHVAAAMRRGPISATHLDTFCEHALGVVPLASVDAAWLADLADPWGHAKGSRGSRVVDVLVSLVLLIPAAPLIAVLLPLIALDREGSPFFRQERVGRFGRPFSILKLRTMRGTGSDWSSPGDARITRLGAVLRKTHLDEVPQLFNVLRGDMAIVGPRPEQVGISAELEHDLPLFPYRHGVRPGITGWARVRSGYARTTEESAIKLGNDLFHMKHRSVLLHVAILVETIRVSLFEDQFEVRPPAAAYVLGSFPRIEEDDLLAVAAATATTSGDVYPREAPLPTPVAA